MREGYGRMVKKSEGACGRVGFHHTSEDVGTLHPYIFINSKNVVAFLVEVHVLTLYTHRAANR